MNASLTDTSGTARAALATGLLLAGIALPGCMMLSTRQDSLDHDDYVASPEEPTGGGALTEVPTDDP